jgi:phospholipid/cholesterol/gamma-HCH transport system ATP-binding protein
MRMSELLDMRKRFGILFQDGALFGSMNVFDNVAFPLRQNTNLSEKEIAEIVHMRLDEVGLSAAEHKAPSELSGGMRKRAGFARALVLEPEIVMFDEPDSGLDPVRTALLCQLIQKVHAQNGGTYIVITHDIASARKIGEYLAVLWKGRIVQSGDREAMFTSENPFVRQFLAGAEQGPLGME